MSSASGSVHVPPVGTPRLPRIVFRWARLRPPVRGRRHREVYVQILHAADIPPT